MQRPDRFIYEGKEYRTNSRECPYPQFYMEAYFKQHPEKRPKSGLMSTALYRRYVATYEITESQLALNDIRIRTGYDPDKWESFRDTIVTGDCALIIDWFTGVIVLHPFDELIDDKRRTSLSLNEGDIETILLQIEDGNLTCVRKFAVGEYKKFQERQFMEFRKTDKYKQAVKERLERGTEPAHVDIVINNFLMFYSGRILVADDQSAQNGPMTRKLKVPNRVKGSV